MIRSPSSTFMYPVFHLVLLALLLGATHGAKMYRLCPASSCGEIRNISYPFRLKSDPKGCGRPAFELACENNRTVLYLYAGRYYVRSIRYNGYYDEDNFFGYITVVDDGLQKGNCSSLPRYSLTGSNFSSFDPYNLLVRFIPSVAFVKCSQPVTSKSYVDTKPCIQGAHSADTPPDVSQTEVYSYALLLKYPLARKMKDFCTITMMSSASESIWERRGYPYNRVRSTYEDIHNAMTEGFDLLYTGGRMASISRICYFGFVYGCHSYYSFSKWNTMRKVAVYAGPKIAIALGHFVAAKFILGAPCLLIFLVYKWRRRHLAMDRNIEEFLQAHNNFLPIRYSYSNIKKITRNFEHKLGEGGFGCVYKGILRSGNEVAVKILNKPKSNGQDFISEVATIGRIHHVNVVQLVGFCFDNSKLALVYNFMSNGSLDKHLFSKDANYSLDYKRIYEISLGVARGIEYLHRGCDMQILHFDIKPHNILLDQNFIPKVSDFGLAKLYPTKHNIVSLTIARGTLGYMAPELFYKDIGGVSYKSDVYSFGMLLMEMAGRRRNVNADADSFSQSYFPLWIYDQLNKGNEVDMVEDEEEREIARKMAIVALWCIQLIPNDRPSMSRVLEMLEGDIDKLRLPSKPLLFPPEKPVDDVSTGIEIESFSTSSIASIIYDGSQVHSDNRMMELGIV